MRNYGLIHPGSSSQSEREPANKASTIPRISEFVSCHAVPGIDPSHLLLAESGAKRMWAGLDACQPKARRAHAELSSPPADYTVWAQKTLHVPYVSPGQRTGFPFRCICLGKSSVKSAHGLSNV